MQIDCYGTEPGFRAVVSRWEESEDARTAVYKVVADEAAGAGRRVFPKLKLVEALKKADKWVLVKTWLEEGRRWTMRRTVIPVSTASAFNSGAGEIS